MASVYFSGLDQSLEDIATHYSLVSDSIEEFFRGYSPAFLARFNAETAAAVKEAKEECMKELGLTSSLSTLAAIEAILRKDYLVRVERSADDVISKEFIKLHASRGKRARLDEILGIWKKFTEDHDVISELKSANVFRDWIAHGRYWSENFNKKYDFLTVYGIAESFYAGIKAHL